MINRKCTIFRNVVSILLIRSLIISSLMTTPVSAQELLNLPVPGTMLHLSEEFIPVYLRGMTVYPEDPFKMDFIIDSGDADFDKADLAKKQEIERLVKYFLASMTVPQGDLWVNLAPNESDRIIPDELGKTELGRDLLAQDYLLKQISASLFHPESSPITHHLSLDNFNYDILSRIWIAPDTATIYEKDNTVYIVDSKLKVFLKDEKNGNTKQGIVDNFLTILEKEINTGKNFAKLRQIYHSLILAKWYKQTIKNSIINVKYSDKNMTNGIEIVDKQIKERIYQRYMEAYKKGAFNYIKDEYDALTPITNSKKIFFRWF